ncbi:MAG: MerR family transcriptional regulator [Anaerolineae bacterium]|nr:MerR family transcriptional regulator [Anaerolineae bacterium]
MYTVKQLADLANISVRTLHHYHDLELLLPSKIGSNGYRYYDDDAVLRLQQVLFYRELGLELLQIKDVLDSPDFDIVAALRSHREALTNKLERTHELIRTVDSTIMHLAGEIDMSNKRLFTGFSDEEQKQYEREARLQWGPDLVNESVQRWESYGDEEKEAIKQEGGQIYVDIAKHMQDGMPINSPEVQELAQRWHQHLRYFYEPTIDILAGLGHTYKTHPDFRKTFEEIHIDLPEYLSDVVAHYVDDLETAAIARLLAEDEAASDAS